MVKLIDPSSTEGGVIYTPELGGAGGTIPKKSFTARLGDKASSVWNIGKKVAAGAAIVGGLALGAKKGYDAYQGQDSVRYKAPEAATQVAPKPAGQSPQIAKPKDWKARAGAAAARGGADVIEGEGGVGGIIAGVGKAIVGKDEGSKLRKKDQKKWEKERKAQEKASKQRSRVAAAQPASRADWKGASGAPPPKKEVKAARKQAKRDAKEARKIAKAEKKKGKKKK